MPLAFIILVIGAIAVIAYLGHMAEKKRRQELRLKAADLGLSFAPQKDHALARTYSFIDRARQGSNRYAYNVMKGIYRNHHVIIFDYHYETHSTDSKGRRRTTHHYLHFITLIMDKSFPELKISREGFFSKIAQAFGYDDIDFESAEFSRKFCVRSTDKKFAYDICHAQMIEYLLDNEDISIELEGNTYAMAFQGRMQPNSLNYNVERIVALRNLMPNYLFGG